MIPRSLYFFDRGRNCYFQHLEQLKEKKERKLRNYDCSFGHRISKILHLWLQYDRTSFFGERNRNRVFNLRHEFIFTFLVIFVRITIFLFFFFFFFGKVYTANVLIRERRKLNTKRMEFHCKVINGFEHGMKNYKSSWEKKVVCRLIIVSIDRVNDCDISLREGRDWKRRNCGILASRKGNAFVFLSTRPTDVRPDTDQMIGACFINDWLSIDQSLSSHVTR